MKKHTFFTMLCVLLVLTGCQKRQEQTDIRLPESDSAVTEETITEPTEKAEEALSEESHAEQEPQTMKIFVRFFKHFRRWMTGKAARNTR